MYLPLLLLLSRFSRVQLCATLWTAALQAPPSLGFSRQEHRSGCLFLLPSWSGKSVLTRKSGALQCRDAATRGRPRRESKAGECLRFALEKTLFKPFSDAASKGALHTGAACRQSPGGTQALGAGRLLLPIRPPFMAQVAI